MTNGEIVKQLENIIDLVKQDGKDWLDNRDIPILEACIKSLTTLNKIKSEIENHCGLLKENHCKYCSYCNCIMGVREILEIIDKYKVESE